MRESISNSFYHMDSDQDTKTKIFSVAARLFSEKGFNGVSMREISEESGVSKPMIYYYFGSKEEIYKALVDTAISHVFHALQEVSALEVPAREKLTVMCKRFFEMSLRFPEFVKFYIGLANVSDQVLFMDNVKKKAESRITILAEMIAAAKKSGEFGSKVDPQIAASILTGTIVHYVRAQFRTKKKILTDRLAESIIDTLFLGFNE